VENILQSWSDESPPLSQIVGGNQSCFHHPTKM
jgi:hypothetical protein